MTLAGFLLAAILPALAVAAELPEPHECIIKPSRTVQVASAVSGLLEIVAVDRGDRVGKGDLIARLESTVEQAQTELLRVRAGNLSEIESGKARFRYQSAKLSRNEKLNQKRLISVDDTELARAEADLARADIKQAELNRRVAQLDYERAKKELLRRQILSPIAGIVSERKLNPGEYVHEQTHIVTIIQIDPLFVESFLPIALYGKVRVGMMLTVRPEAPVGGSYAAKVSVVDQLVDAASGTFAIRLTLANKEHHLPAGLRCTVF